MNNEAFLIDATTHIKYCMKIFCNLEGYENLEDNVDDWSYDQLKRLERMIFTKAWQQAFDKAKVWDFTPMSFDDLKTLNKYHVIQAVYEKYWKPRWRLEETDLMESPFDGFYQNRPTPYKIVREMILSLGDEVLDNPLMTYYDGFCSDGTFLVVLKEELLYRFWDSKQEWERIPTWTRKDMERHIIENMLFYDDENPNRVLQTKLRLDPEGKFCHNEGVSMDEAAAKKIKVWVGNPPYQKNDGGGANGISATAVYPIHIRNAKKHAEVVSFIIPDKWMLGGKGEAISFRDETLKDVQFRKIVEYPDANTVFPEADIPGGVCHFLWKRGTKGPCKITVKDRSGESTTTVNLSEFKILVPDRKAFNIAQKVLKHSPKTMDNFVWARKPFGFESKVDNDPEGDIVCHLSHGKTCMVKRSSIKKNAEHINKIQVCIPKVIPGGGRSEKIFSYVKLIPAGEVCSETFLVHESTDNLMVAENAKSYFETKFVRFLVRIATAGQNLCADRFLFVPYLPMTEEWTDEKLYKRYNLTEEEIAYIESKIRPMNASAKAA